VVDQLNAAFRHAAGRIRAELLAQRFRTEYCLDKGCPLKNGEADWLQSLRRWARKPYDFCEQDPQQLGYTVRAET
jgi:hypothetical protein